MPADARVFEAVALQTVEAALTGESTPVTKDVAPIPIEVGLGDRTNMVLSGTLVSYGRGRAVVTATGGAAPRSGQWRDCSSRTTAEQTPLQRELEQVGRLLGRIVVAIALVVAVTIVLVQQVRTLPALVSVLLLAVALAVAAVPEGLTAITTIVLSLGTERMARRRVIIRKLSAVQALGSATVICSDKTGTLTKNEMTVRAAVTAGGRTDFTGTGYEPSGELMRQGRPVEDPGDRADVERLLRAAVLASNATLSRGEDRWEVLGDPTEGALVVAARKAGVVEQLLAARFSRVGEIPFSSERKLMSTAQTDTDRGGRTVLVSKGAPDILLARCTHERVGEQDLPLTAERRHAILAIVEGLAGEALRTLGLAFRVLERAEARPGFDLELEQESRLAGCRGDDRPAAPGGAASGAGGPRGGHPDDHDHGRPSRHGRGDRRRARHRSRRQPRPLRVGATGDGRGRAAAGRAAGLRVRPGEPRAQAADRGGATEAGRGRGHDGRRGERRPGPEARGHRRGDGHRRHRRVQGGGGHGPGGRQLRLDRGRGRGGPRDLRQHPEVPPVPALLERGRGDGHVLRRGVRGCHRPAPGGGGATRAAAPRHHDPVGQPADRLGPRPRAGDGRRGSPRDAPAAPRPAQPRHPARHVARHPRPRHA